MAHCLSCHSYVIHQSLVCASCCEKSSHLRVVRDHLPDDYYHSNFRYRMIKGKLAETLVEQLFLSHKYMVYRYGMEHTLPGIPSSLRRNKKNVPRYIKSMPDFVVQHLINKDTNFVEVKFRASGCFSAEDIDKDYPYDDALIIVVSKRHIKCLSVGELKEGKTITENSNNYLADRPEFDLRKDVVIDFCKFAKMFFDGIRAEA